MAKRKSNKQVKAMIKDVVLDVTGEPSAEWVYFSCRKMKHFAELIINHGSVFDEAIYFVGKPVSIKANG